MTHDMGDTNPYKSPHSTDDSSEQDKANSARLSQLTSFLNLADAQVCQAILRQEGIESFLDNEGSIGVSWLWSNAIGGVKVLVSSEDLEKASQLLAEELPADNAAHSSGPVTFVCDECGAEITFPEERRGHVETCPKCQRYVDVPE